MWDYMIRLLRLYRKEKISKFDNTAVGKRKEISEKDKGKIKRKTSILNLPSILSFTFNLGVWRKGGTTQGKIKKMVGAKISLYSMKTITPTLEMER